MFEWPVDKVGVINSALAQCGDNLVNAADDGSLNTAFRIGTSDTG